MGANSAIEWTTHTFNPWIGCTRVSPGCQHCYAESLAKRTGLAQWGPEAERRVTSDANWRLPLKWAKQARETGERPRVFCASLADVFEDRLELVEPRTRLWRLIFETPELDWLLLTKRPENVRRMVPWITVSPHEPWPNVWLGTTVEDQKRADERVPHLLATPAAVRFLSCEPLLGPLDLEWPESNQAQMCCAGTVWDECGCRGMPVNPPLLYGIDWVICGGESGPAARPMHPQWARSLRDQCQRARASFLFKQWGEYGPCGFSNGLDSTSNFHRFIDGQQMERYGKKAAGRLLDGRTWDEFPKQIGGAA